MKIVVAFEKEVSEAEQKLFDKFVVDNNDLANEVEGIGGGIKNPKKE
jgi:hypothetical protein